MDENHQDKTRGSLRATENHLWIPPLAPKEQKELDRLQQKLGKKSLFQWTGFAGKTLWDWLPLLIQLIGAIAIPIGLLVGVTQFNLQQTNDRQKSTDEQQQTTLQDYLDHMSNLLLQEHLRESKSGDVVRQVAEAQTLTAAKIWPKTARN
ncbi:MAG: hypothetical protein JO183_02605 [Ktedonobacteraceae bacterium]|nr:hypothetical protein [Ktedonobacteraceae bacterium]